MTVIVLDYVSVLFSQLVNITMLVGSFVFSNLG